MKISDTFFTCQGEINVGKLAYFIRLGMCNLNCVWCDTPERFEYMDMDLNDIFEQAKHFNRIVITGGEPLLQKEDIAKLIKKLQNYNPKVVIEIETNGTIKPVGIKGDVIFNVSPKLKNSEMKYESRFKPDVLNWFKEYGANFKFVVTNEDDLDEVNMIVSDLLIPKEQVFLMAEGMTREHQMERMLPVFEMAKSNGYNFSPRLQILLWDTKRGV